MAVMDPLQKVIIDGAIQRLHKLWPPWELVPESPQVKMNAHGGPATLVGLFVVATDSVLLRDGIVKENDEAKEAFRNLILRYVACKVAFHEHVSEATFNTIKCRKRRNLLWTKFRAAYLDKHFCVRPLIEDVDEGAGPTITATPSCSQQTVGTSLLGSWLHS